LVSNFVVALNDLLAANLSQLLYGGRLKIEPMTVGIDHGMVETRMNLGSFGSMLR